MMTPQQFSAYVTSSVPVATNEDGDTQQNFANAHGPAFIQGVKVCSANGQVNPVNATYCATDDCAAKLLELMQAADPSLKALSPGISYGDPYQLTSSGWNWFSTTVPRLRFHFDLGYFEDNAAQLAIAFSHGQEPSRQVRYVIWSIKSDAYVCGFSSMDPGPFQG